MIVSLLAALVASAQAVSPPSDEQFAAARQMMSIYLDDYPRAAFSQVRADETRICGVVEVDRDGKTRATRFLIENADEAGVVFEGPGDYFGQIASQCVDDPPAFEERSFAIRMVYDPND